MAVPFRGRGKPESPEVREALAQVDRIVDAIEEEVGEDARDKAANFFDSVLRNTKSVGETIVRTQRVTPKQQDALDGWEKGVRKWIRD